MLTNFRVKNFKSLRDSGDIAFRPLTLLIGPNSSGKSSLLQALLMIKQTVLSRDVENPLTLQGPYVSLPPFPDLVHRQDVNSTLEFLLGNTFEASPVLGSKADVAHSLRIKTRFDPVTQTMSRAEVRCEWKTGSLRQVFGEDLVSWTEVPSSNGGVTLKVQVGAQEIVEELPPGTPLLVFPSIRQFRLQKGDLDPGRILAFMALTIPAAVSYGLQSLFYVGPIRESPHRYYEITGEAPADVGLRGERAVQVLQRAANKGLVELVNRWLVELGIASKVEVVRLSPSLYKVSVRDAHTDVPVNLADVGFGASQILPIIVQGYLQPERSTLLLEQPEIHLHARSQGVLADVFMDIAKRNRQLVVETHSQHVVTRIQRRIAEGRFDRKDVALYYFEPTPEGTRIRELEIDQGGNLRPDTVPEGFFMELYEDTSRMFDATSKRSSKSKLQAVP